MKNRSFAIDAVLEDMPLVQAAVRDEIAKRVADGDEIYHARNGNLMVNDRVIKPLGATAGASGKRVERRAA
jgi:hypothetical protein